jgi:phenylacetate-CoA ligase
MAVRTAWDQFRDDVHAATLTGMSELTARLSWSSEQINRAQREGLHRLLLHAAEHSPFHRRRLAGIDLTALEPAALCALPVMTKAEMMDAFDDVLTERRVGRRDVEAALAATGARPIPVLENYVALASGGSSGRRGLFVYDRSAITAFFAAMTRPPIADPAASGFSHSSRLCMAVVAAPSAVHAAAFGAALTSGDGWPSDCVLVPATLSLAKIVKRLNTIQPTVLGGYASMLTQLAFEANSGRLRITPEHVSSMGETLLPEMRSVISHAFGVPVLDSFACTEGLVGRAGPDDNVLVFNTDLCIVELVDADNQPVAAGVAAAKVLVTNLYNMIQPLIRYELSDVFTRLPDASEHGHLRALVHGRSDEVLNFGSTDVHPSVIRSVMARSQDVIDYQVHQVPNGIDVFAVTTDQLDVDDLTAQLRWALVGAGLECAHAAVKRVDRLERHPSSGKLRRFVPILA